MYNIEIPDTINRIIRAFYLFGFWNKDENTFFKKGRNFFHISYYVLFVISIAVGAWIADNKDDSIFLTGLSITCSLQIFRMCCIILKETQIYTLIHLLSNQSTNDHKKFIQVNHKLEIIMKLVTSTILVCIAATVFIAIMPFTSTEKKLAFNVAFPLNWRNSETVFWVVHVYIIVGAIYVVISALLALIIWYLMISCAIKCVLLGNQLRNINVIGTMGKPKVLTRDQQNSFAKHIIAAIESHRTIDK